MSFWHAVFTWFRMHITKVQIMLTWYNVIVPSGWLEKTKNEQDFGYFVSSSSLTLAFISLLSAMRYLSLGPLLPFFLQHWNSIHLLIDASRTLSYKLSASGFCKALLLSCWYSKVLNRVARLFFIGRTMTKSYPFSITFKGLTLLIDNLQIHLLYLAL